MVLFLLCLHLHDYNVQSTQIEAMVLFRILCAEYDFNDQDAFPLFLSQQLSCLRESERKCSEMSLSLSTETD